MCATTRPTRVLLGHRHLGNRRQAHAAPVVVIPAPCRHAMKVADVVGLRQREKFVPRQRERMLDESADFEPPLVERNLGLLAEVEHRPVLHLVLPDGELRHAVTILRPAALRRLSRELDVDSSLVELNLPLDVFLPPFYQIVVRHMDILVAPSPLGD